MNTRNTSRLAQLGLLVLTTMAGSAIQGQTINFAQAPAGASAREPAPNVIVSVDDSGSMGVTGMATLKSALTATFSINNVADGRIRLAWQSMNTCMALSTNGTTPANCGAYNGIASLEGSHRTNFLTWVTNNLPANPPGANLTPSHLMMQRAGEYLRTTGQYSPFRSEPGSSTNTTELSCRKSFNIFMTDGAWNTFQSAPYLDGSAVSVGGGNADGTAKTFPDGTLYTPETPQTRVYSDPWGLPNLSTLSDVAFHYWSTDLQPALTNNVRPSITQAGSETVGGTTLGEYWNPRNNVANWQGMTTYSIGFNPLATTWLGSPTYTVASGMYGGTGYVGVVNGTQEWTSPLCTNVNGNPDNVGGNFACNYANNASNKFNARANYRSSELWHLALNSRGRFVPAPDAQSLVTAFQTILDDILAQTARPLVSIATSSSRASVNNFAYVAGYDSAADWKGSLKAFAINRATSRPATTPTWEAQALLDNISDTAIDSRVILSHNGSQGVGFRWGNLSITQREGLQGTNSVAVGTARVNYLRGDRRLESTQTGGYMRNRSSRLGDIVNSNIWHLGKPTRQPIDLPGHAAFRSSAAIAGRTPTLYVGANDGMLHAFDAASGRELMAYVPAGLYGNLAFSPLRSYTQTSYSHRYFVDGSPFTGDVNVQANTGGVDWRTLLVGTLGAGGKGYFVLDVTNPSNFVDPGAGSSAVVRLDTTINTDPDIGHVFATPVVDGLTRSRSEQIVRVNDSNAGGRWAVILGNGYNSTNQRPVLVVQYLDGTMGPPRLIQASTDPVINQGNGLGAPRPIDLNGDGKVDVVFAGDLKGNLWKFDLSSNNPSSWGVAFGGNPLFVARDSTGTVQPITAAPYWQIGPNNLGGLQVMFGTGVNLSGTDPGSTQVQTIYSVWDNTIYSFGASTPVTGTGGSVITGSRNTALVEQTQTAANGRYFGTSSNAVTYSRTLASAKRGWFFDLPVSGERVLNHPMAFEGQVIRVDSVVPASAASGETCDLSVVRGSGYINLFNIHSGKPPETAVFGTNEAGDSNGNRVQYGSGDSASIEDLTKNQSELFVPEATCPPGDDACFQCTPGVDCPDDECTPGVDCPPDENCRGLNGRFLTMCQSAAGQRTDWREFR